MNDRFFIVYLDGTDECYCPWAWVKASSKKELIKACEDLFDDEELADGSVEHMICLMECNSEEQAEDYMSQLLKGKYPEGATDSLFDQVVWDEDYWIDPAGGIHDDDDDDPAAMYK